MSQYGQLAHQKQLNKITFNIIQQYKLMINKKAMLILTLMLASLTLFPVVLAYDCTAIRLPLIFGGTDGSSEIVSVSSYNANVFFAGTSTDSSMLASGASQSVFYGKYHINNQRISYLIAIDDANINQVEKMEGFVDEGSTDLLILASSNAEPNAFFLFQIVKDNGVITKSTKISSTQIPALASADARAISSNGYGNIFSATMDRIYIAVSMTDGSSMGLLKLNDFQNNNDIDWWQQLTCTFCKATALVESVGSEEYIYMAAIEQDAVNDKTLGQLHHFGKDGAFHWSHQYEMGPQSLSSFLTIQRMLSIDNGEKLITYMSDPQSAGNTYLTIFEGLSVSDHSQEPTAANVYLIASTDVVRTQKMFGQTDNVNVIIYLLQAVNPGTGSASSRILKVNIQGLVYTTITFPMSSGANFLVNDLSKDDLQSSATNFYYVGKTVSATDGTISQTFTTEQAFIMRSDTSSADLTCLSHSTDYNPSMGGASSLVVDTTYTWSAPTTAPTWTLTDQGSLAQVDGTIMSYTDVALAKNMNDRRWWCTRASSLSFVDPPELASAITYTSKTAASETHYTNFSLSDSSCDAVEFVTSMSCTWIKTDSTSGTWSNMPSLVQDTAGDHSWHILAETTDNTQDGTYTCTLTIKKAAIPLVLFGHNLAFTLTVQDTYCQSVAVTAPSSEDSFQYSINATSTERTQYAVQAFTFDASCSYYMSYSLAFAQPGNGTTIDNSGATAVYFDNSLPTQLEVWTKNNDHESYGATIGWLYILTMSASNYHGVAATHTIKLEIIANCSTESVTKPGTGPFVNDTYTIHATEKILSYTNWDNWISSRASCTITYSITTNDKSKTDFATIVAGSGVQIYSTDNNYGGTTVQLIYYASLNVSYTGGWGTNSSDLFYVEATKDCSGATLTPAYISDYVHNYTTYTGTQTLESIQVSSESGCDVAYTHYWQDNSTQLDQVDSNAITWDYNNNSQAKFMRNKISFNCDDNRHSDVELNYLTHQGIQIRAYTYSYYYPSTIRDNTDYLITVYITPNCSYETMNNTDTIDSPTNHRILTGAQDILIPPMDSSLAYCTIYLYSITVNGTNITDSSLSSMFSFDQSTMILTVEVNDNQYGNADHAVVVHGLNIGQHMHNNSFTLHTEKNCEYATLYGYDFEDDDVEYIITDSHINIPLKNAFSNDTNCYREYELQYPTNAIQNNLDPGNPAKELNYVAFVTGSTNHDYIRLFNTTNTDNGTYIHFEVGATDHSFLNNYQTVNYTIRIKNFIRVEDHGNSLQDYYSNMTLRIDSWCSKVIFANTDLNLSYFIRNSSQTVDIPQLAISWPDGSKTASQIYSACGEPVYQLYNSSTNDLTDFSTSIFTSFTPGVRTNADPNSHLTYYSDVPEQGGGLDSGGVMQSAEPHQVYVKGRLNGGVTNSTYFAGYWKAHGTTQINLTAYDDCWVTTIYQNYPEIQQKYSTIKQALYYQFPQFSDTVSTTYPNSTGLAPQYISQPYCGPLIYDIVQENGSALDPSWKYENFTTNTMENFFQIDDNIGDGLVQIYAYSDDQEYVKIFKLAVKASFQYEENYPVFLFPIQIQFGRCLVTSVFDPSEVKDHVFNIHGGYNKYIIDYTVLYQLPYCEYTPYFTSQVANDTTGGLYGDNSAWPSWLTFKNETTDPSSSMFYELLVNDLSFEGVYYDFYLSVTFVNELLDDPKDYYVDKVINIPWRLSFVYFPYNEAPFYSKKIKNQVIKVGGSAIVTTGPASSDVTKVTWTLQRLDLLPLFEQFTQVQINPATKAVTFDFKPTENEQQGTYNIEIRIVDSDPPEPKEAIYKFFVVVKINQDLNEQLDEKLEEAGKEVEDKSSFAKKLKMKISSIDNNGKIVVDFNINMNQTLFEQLKGMSQLELKQILSIVMIPTADQDPTKVGIKSYKVIDYNQKQLIIKASFQYPMYISSAKTRDQLQIIFRKKNYIISDDGQQPPKNRISFNKVPEQLDDSGGQDFLKSAMDLQNSMQSTAFTSLVSNIAWQGPINHFWGMINTVQVSAHAQLINCEVPSNIGIFNNITMKLIYFDILPDEGLQYFYFWKLIDGSYNQEEGGDEDAKDGGKDSVNNLTNNSSEVVNKSGSNNSSEEETKSSDGRMLLSYGDQRRNLQNGSLNNSSIDFDDNFGDQGDDDEIEVNFCNLEGLKFCQLDYMVSYQEKVDHVNNILKERGKVDQYTQVQIDSLAAYKVPIVEATRAETQLERMAYGSTSIIENMGTVFVIWEVFFIYVCLIKLVRYCCFPLMRLKCFRQYMNDLDKSVFWGSFLRFGLEVYLEAVVAAQINIRNEGQKFNLSDSELHNNTSFYFAIAIAFFAITFPIFSGLFLLKFRKIIMKEQSDKTKYILSYLSVKTSDYIDQQYTYLRKYSTIFDGVAIKYRSQILFYPIFMLRRMFLAMILVQLEQQPQFQIMSMTALNLAFSAYLGQFKPLEGYFANRVELFGEFMNMLICFNFFVFTDYVPDLETRAQWGFSSIAYFCLMIGVNMIIIAVDQLNALYHYCVRKQRQKAQDKRLERYLESRRLAEEAHEKRLAEIIKTCQGNEQSNISQQRMYIHALMDKSVSAELQKDKEIRRQIHKGVNEFSNSNIFLKDPANGVKFHTARFGQYNRFSDMVGKRVRIQDGVDKRKVKEEEEQEDQAFKVSKRKSQSLKLNFNADISSNLAKDNKMQSKLIMMRSQNQSKKKHNKLSVVVESQSDETNSQNNESFKSMTQVNKNVMSPDLNENLHPTTETIASNGSPDGRLVPVFPNSQIELNFVKNRDQSSESTNSHGIQSKTRSRQKLDAYQQARKLQTGEIQLKQRNQQILQGDNVMTTQQNEPLTIEDMGIEELDLSDPSFQLKEKKQGEVAPAASEQIQR